MLTRTAEEVQHGIDGGSGFVCGALERCAGVLPSAHLQLPRLVQDPLHKVKPWGQVHTPPLQLVPPLHTLPQAPQFKLSPAV